ncbi:hypothetical protein F0562_003666 [Nyssa sinensis]|uniref:Peptidyl-prolyl cis-trans isomerase n=1 Tax=Nyssa sinensis TaxID=561372 RepID=A0A5J5BZW6_9ASTE|nr:hypothetical protein F0562_003666 [Nyssa sinensis]
MSSDKVRASHILIKHQGSRRKASWKDPEGRVITNTTRDSAVSQLKALRDDIVSGKAKFDDVATRYSDCSSAKRGGDLVAEGGGAPLPPNFNFWISACENQISLYMSIMVKGALLLFEPYFQFGMNL